MSPKLKMLERKMLRQEQAQAPTPADDDLTTAIQRLIDQRVEQALEQQPVKQPPQVQRLLDQQCNRHQTFVNFKQVPTPPRTPAPPMRDISFDRDEFGRICAAHCGNLTFFCQRNELGQVVRLIPSDVAPMPSAVAPAKVNQPRKIYGNDPEGQ
ncbi:hypothetical protein ACIQUS_23180 [Pseudomonas sp. NPDC090755]|uniref:hypothetical protein n=1 Tax=Pseudomonas sp. NPDC090755 TaxID=3364481 RepID=UPI00383BCA6F